MFLPKSRLSLRSDNIIVTLTASAFVGAVFVLPKAKLAAFAAMCLDGTLKSCYNNLGLKSSDDDLPHKNAEVHTHLSENVLALNSFAVQNSGVPPLWLDSHLI